MAKLRPKPFLPNYKGTITVSTKIRFALASSWPSVRNATVLTSLRFRCIHSTIQTVYLLGNVLSGLFLMHSGHLFAWFLSKIKGESLLFFFILFPFSSVSFSFYFFWSELMFGHISLRVWIFILRLFKTDF